jgi:uncharacterized protein (TIGR03086 family)
MSEIQLITRVAGHLVRIIDNIEPHQLDARTPCAQWDVRKVVNHLLFWGPSEEGAARKELVPPPAEDEADVDLTEGDWAHSLAANIDRIAAAWSEPSAWDGVTHLGGPREMPASLIGGMIVGELVVHGWDLARATGQIPEWDDDLLRYVHDEIAKTSEQAREVGLYGPEVAVPISASILDRVVGLTGRDPAWTP